MKKEETDNQAELLKVVEAVDNLSEETKDLALNLALCLARAKAKHKSEELYRLEPEFIRLVNGSIKVVQELTMLLKAVRNQEVMVYEVPSGRITKDRLEKKLEEIVEQCNQIQVALGKRPNIIA